MHNFHFSEARQQKRRVQCLLGIIGGFEEFREIGLTVFTWERVMRSGK
jgi:hypothetical protein